LGGALDVDEHEGHGSDCTHLMVSIVSQVLGIDGKVHTLYNYLQYI
jgi:hypothetical protein